MNEQVVGKVQQDPVVAPVSEGARAPSSPARHGRRVWLIGGLLSVLLIVGLGGTSWWLLSGPAKVQYSTGPVTRGPVIRAVTATGTVNPILTIIVGSYVSGVIQALYCDYNTKVTKGQVCAKIDPRPYQTLVDQNKANLAVAKAQLEKDKANLAYLKLSYDRDLTLVKTQAVSQDVVDSGKNAYDQGLAQIEYDQATIDQRQAELDAAQVNLDYTDIVSPVDGTVVSRNVTMGQTVASSFQTPTLFLIATDLTKMQVDTNVSESDVGGVKENNSATFSVDAYPKRAFAGTVTQVRQSPQTVQNVVTFDIVVSAANPDLALMPGMTASTKIVVDSRPDVIRVPDQALRYAPSDLKRAAPLADSDAGEPRLWLLRGDKPVAVPIVPGLDDETYTEIVKGDVKPGDQVILSEQRGAGGRTAVPPPRF
ncbi:MAG: efflux RND transporter periplasmic adaptor subunit [Beijerinckiaceae bacterium]|nr:efflux RND transporter periplasmic adaptor subunit [Beijerinckiaceae bacterium]